jgi:hypothetical protein
MTIIINTQKYSWAKPSISYEDLIKLAGKTEGILYTVNYYAKKIMSGSLTPGQSVEAISGTVFNISHTNNG